MFHTRLSLISADIPFYELKKTKPPKIRGFVSSLKRPLNRGVWMLAEWTGLEPATPGVTGRYSNQLNYHSKTAKLRKLQKLGVANYRNRQPLYRWRPHGDSNPGTYRERVVS